jgi:UDP-N-acetylmuramoyl-tripeptide--D-alanyl-D-alanine ligase
MSRELSYKLALLQLEQYDTTRYTEKLRGPKNYELVKRIKWTKRLAITRILATIMGVILANVIIGVVVELCVMLVELWVQLRLRALKRGGMRVVALAGSYGKTSVKHYVYELLRHKYRVVATPESYNTIMGIAKCLYWEVDQKTEIFVVEVGAYHVGDITRMLKMVTPDLGVLTGIARQHLERFGSYENIKEAKGEIAVYAGTHGIPLVANGSDKVVAEVAAARTKAITWYGKTEDRNATNLEGAACVANLLGMTKAEIEAAKAQVRTPRSRFEMTTTRYGMPVIDDSFSSNDVSFVSALEYLGKQKDCTRILVTPGIVELGDKSKQIHEELGSRVVGNVDILILVGDSERTKSLRRGAGASVKILQIAKTLDFVALVKSLKLVKKPLVLLENDVTENYN